MCATGKSLHLCNRVKLAFNFFLLRNDIIKFECYCAYKAHQKAFSTLYIFLYTKKKQNFKGR